MLTKEQCKKLGIQYVELAEESARIDFYQQDLLNQVNNLKNSTPKFVLPPTNFNYTQWKNFESDPSKIPFQYWMSGSGMNENMLNLKYIPLYYYN